MPATDAVNEFRNCWLPHVTDAGLQRLIGLLERADPLLIHGAFARAMPMGCLATHIAWNHPATCNCDEDAGIIWLSRIAKLNPATSAVILAWDEGGTADFELRTALLAACQEEAARRYRTTVPGESCIPPRSWDARELVPESSHRPPTPP